MPAYNQLPNKFEDAVKLYADTVARVCAVHMGNAEDAQDCFQNTFIKLYSRFPDFTDCEHMKAWLLRVAINECRSAHRYTLRRKSSSLEEISEVFTQPPDEGGLLETVMTLKPEYRDVIYLHYYEGYPVAEVSKLLNTNENTVKTRLSRARARLKTLLTDGGE